METSLKTGFAQIFSCCPKLGGGSSPPRAPGPYAYDSYYVFTPVPVVKYISDYTRIRLVFLCKERGMRL